MSTTTATAPAPARETISEFRLTAADRCDTCQAQAYVEVTVEGYKSELLFCAHHFKKYEEKLTELDPKVHDERARLFEEQIRKEISA